MRKAYGQLFASAGLDPLPQQLPSDGLADIARALAASETRWQEGDFGN